MRRRLSLARAHGDDGGGGDRRRARRAAARRGPHARAARPRRRLRQPDRRGPPDGARGRGRPGSRHARRRARRPWSTRRRARWTRASRSSARTGACWPTRRSPAPSSQAVENHGGRPEVVGALAGQRLPRRARERDRRGAPALRGGPDPPRGRVVGVARLSRGIERIEAQGRALWRSAALAGLAGARRERARVAAALGLRSAARSARSWRPPASSRAATSRPASGCSREDELGELARIINRSADELQLRLAEIARDRGRTDAILSAMDDGVLAVDHRGTVTLANPSLDARDGDELPARPPLPRDDPPARGGGARRGRARERRAPRGRGRAPGAAPQLHRSPAVPFPGEEGAPHGAVLTFNDTTERQRLDAHAPRLRGERLARAAHAAHLDPRLRRGARGRRQGRARHRRALPRQDPHPRRPHGGARRGPARAVAARVERARARAGRDAARPRWPPTWWRPSRSRPRASRSALRHEAARRRPRS